MEISSPKKIKVTNIKGKGRGVVAIKNIKKGEIIEYCPVVFISRKEADFFEKGKTILNYYYLQQPEHKKAVLMLGYGLLYNHSKEPNAEIDYDVKDLKDYLFFRALRKIKKGEEIVYDYQFDNDKEKFLKLD